MTEEEDIREVLRRRAEAGRKLKAEFGTANPSPPRSFRRTMKSRRRGSINDKRFTIVCSCVDPAVVVSRYNVEPDPTVRAELLALHEHPSVREEPHVLKPVERHKNREDILRRRPPVAEELRDGPEYEVPGETAKLDYRTTRAIFDAGWRSRKHGINENGEPWVATQAKADDIASYQGTRLKPIEWRCPKCRRTVRPTAKQADTVAHELLKAGVSRVDLVALARTLGQ